MIRLYCDICKEELKEPEFFTDDARNFRWRRCSADAPFHHKYIDHFAGGLLLCEDCLDVVSDALERIKTAETDADE